MKKKALYLPVELKQLEKELTMIQDGHPRVQLSLFIEYRDAGEKKHLWIYPRRADRNED